MESVKILSEPEDEMMPLAISKWKLNTSLEAKLNYRSISLEISGSVPNSESRKDLQEHSEIFSTVRNLQRSIHRRSERKEPRGSQHFQTGIFPQTGSAGAESTVL